MYKMKMRVMCQLLYNVWTVCFCAFSCHSKGLENSWDRHEKVAEYFHTGLENMGLKLFVQEKVRFNTVVCCCCFLLIISCTRIYIMQVAVITPKWYKMIKVGNVLALTDFSGCYRKQDCPQLPPLLLLMDMTGKRSQRTSWKHII